MEAFQLGMGVAVGLVTYELARIFFSYLIWLAIWS